MTARLHTTGPQPFSRLDALTALEHLPMDDVLLHGPREVLTVGELHRRLIHSEVTAGVVGAYLVCVGKPLFPFEVA